MKQTTRQKAEDILREQYSLDDLSTNQDITEVIHELRVHQIELEMQNDELRLAQEDLQKTQKKYFDLFNFAPVGYLTLDEKGVVKDINLSGAAMLGQERRLVTQRPFIVHLDTTQPIFMHHLNAVFKSDTPKTCELLLKNKHGAPTVVRLRSVVRREKNALVCWSVMTDITDLRRAEDAQRLSENQL
ncbi:MAG: PAS domain-containing protein, partial [Anaerolineales bacterium]|nr:PAS domain-containing protein [Anaerolineales bacterium]